MRKDKDIKMGGRIYEMRTKDSAGSRGEERQFAACG